jgi:hypothetical protein
MTRRGTDPLAYYASHSPITDPGAYMALLQELPVEIPALCKILQGILMHHCSAGLRGVELSDERREEQELRWVARMLARIVELDDRPLLEPRQPDRRLVVCCRDFATLLCAALRHRGVPARARCGFAAYFRDCPDLAADFYVDHWACEYWNADERSWVLVDAEIDEVERQHYQIQIDTLDLPHDQFLLAGRAWQLCRSGQADAERFGLGSDGMRGLWYIQSQLVRDLAALNKMELLCWDCWGLGDRGPDDQVSGTEHALLDCVAALTQQATAAFAELRVLYATDPRLRVPPVINSYTRKGVRRIDLAAG